MKRVIIDPAKNMPRGLPKDVKNSLRKSRESALTAVEIYNKPAVDFRSGGYIVLMVIAWTSLFHAYFYRNGIKPYKRKQGSRRFDRIDGDYKYWELSDCLKQYFGNDTRNPIRVNLDFFIRIRNKIEHRSFSEVDLYIFGECQALLLNYDAFLIEHFGKKYSFRESLVFSLQMYPDPKGMEAAMNNNNELKNLVTFIDDFRSSISKDTFENQAFAFKAFLIQVKNHDTKNTNAIKFINYEALSTAQQDDLDKITAVYTKEKIKLIVNAGLKKPKIVVSEVNEILSKDGWKGKPFGIHHHTDMWKRFSVRPIQGTGKKDKTRDEYCKYDEPNNAYLYTSDWVRFCATEYKKSG